MGKNSGCNGLGLKQGPWTPEEDQKLFAYIEKNGHPNWRTLPLRAGIQRCGKSCRIRWMKYLRPHIKRGEFTPTEEQNIIQLHALLGNRWSDIATFLAGRTESEIKKHWKCRLKKRLSKMGIDPQTHKRKTSSFDDNKSAILNHMAQWETTRLEAEARLANQLNLKNQKINHFESQITNNLQNTKMVTFNTNNNNNNIIMAPCLDILKARDIISGTTTNNNNLGIFPIEYLGNNTNEIRGMFDDNSEWSDRQSIGGGNFGDWGNLWDV